MSESNGHWHPNGNGNGNGRHPDAERGKVQQGEPKVHWENLMSLRFWFGGLFGALVFTFAVSLVTTLAGFSPPDLLIEGCFVGYLVLALIGGLVGRRYWCPFCRGMVKPGATVCRRCGREFEV